MRINYNVSAAIANKRLLGIEGELSKSMERLSSGLKLNHAKDNPAGMAISNKMRAQINGLNRASENASDGISVIRIADGALNETTSILQRMRELSVQAANSGAMSDSDRQAIQDEIESLKAEIDRISTDTEYNTRPLLDGSLDTRVYSEHATRVQVSDQVKEGNYSIEVDKPATQATVNTNGKDFNDQKQTIGASGTVSVNGAKVEISAGDTMAQVYEKIRNAAELGEVTVQRDANNGNLTFTSNDYGKNAGVALTFDNEQLANAFGLQTANGNKIEKDPDNGTWVYGQKDPATNKILTPKGTDIEFKKNGAGNIALEGFSSSATVTTDGNRVTITDRGGVSLSFLAQAGYQGKIEFEVTDMGSMTLHIGANKDQNMDVRIPEVSCESLFIDDLDVRTVYGADRGMTRLSQAIEQTTSVRARLGACENRLDYSVNSLDAFEENMTGAFSRLTDADMAEEMTNYTHQNVLNQAAISVLTQANEQPQQILQILRP